MTFYKIPLNFLAVNFTQKHEIRQVYVRSTARVYEIYYAPDLHSENEYLCTVRCNAASITDVKNAISANLEGLNEISPKGRVSGENNIGTNEDDWVEIKLPVGNTYSPNQTSNAIKNYQVLQSKMSSMQKNSNVLLFIYVF